MAASRKVKLGEIAYILNGLPDNRQSEPADSTRTLTYSFVQPNHLGVFNDIPRLSEIKRSAPIDDIYLIQRHDVLFKRLNPDTATLVTEDLSNTTFSSNLFVIRIFRDYYPAYIACLLENQGLAWLNGNIVGSAAAIKSISIKALAELDIPAIKYEKQETIGQIWLLHKKRQQLLNALAGEDQRFMAAVINRTTSRTEEDE